MTITVHQIPLAARVSVARHGQISQPEYCFCLVRQWAQMPVKAYFGRSDKWRALFQRLGLELSANPTYQEVAAMMDPADKEFMNELLLLAAPIWALNKGGKKP